MARAAHSPAGTSATPMPTVSSNRESAHTESKTAAQRFLKQRITEITTGQFHGTKVDRTMMFELLKDVIADYELKDRHSVDSMACHLIDKYLLPHFGEMRAVSIKVPTLTAYVI